MQASAKSTPVFRDATKPFRDAGILVKYLLPIAPPDGDIGSNGTLQPESMGKSPGRWDRRRREWRGLFGAYIKEGVPEDEAEQFEGWPTSSVGLLGRYVPAIDSDAESPEARELVETVLAEVFGRNAAYAERWRGKGDRRLYAFECRHPNDMDSVVRGRHLSYRLSGVDHKIDVIGYGNQFLAAGLHQNRRDQYEWNPDRDLFELWDRQEIALLDNATVNLFLDTFVDELERAGGELVRLSGGAAIGEDRDYGDQEPTMPLRAVLDGLDRLPNTEANFPHRDDLVGVLAAIRATLGAEAEAAADDIEEWATRDGWADEAYFRKQWDSLGRGVRVGRHTLSRIFRQNRIFPDAKTVFPDDEVSRGASGRLKVESDDLEAVLGQVADSYIFGRVNTRTDDGTLRMRHAFEPGVEFRGIAWWGFRTEDTAVGLIESLHQHFERTEAGFWDFIRALRAREASRAKKDPDALRSFYIGETKNPNFRRGEIVPEPQPDGNPTFLLNMRFQSPVIRFAREAPDNPAQAAADLETVLDFIDRVFGEPQHVKYELDTLAFMVQTGRRPGHMLFLQGDRGVGKSIYSAMLVSMFDGTGYNQGGQIDGTKLMSEASRRFALANVEGCRIINVKELPDGSTITNQKAVTAALKQIVDAGPDADYFQIEAKGKDSRSVRNFARVISTSNFSHAIEVEEHDRRIFFKSCGITLHNKPPSEYYADLTAVTLNPERLATFWRYLLRRDVRGYDPSKPPPVSAEKELVQLAALKPFDRHLRAALALLRQAKRTMTDAPEIANLMTAMADNEHENSGGDIDDRKTYDFASPSGKAQAKKLLDCLTKVWQGKLASERAPTVYGLRSARSAWGNLTGAHRRDVKEALDADRRRRLPVEHNWPLFRGPAVPAKERQ